MAKLILSMDGLVLKEVPLTKERTTIGRRPHNDVVIDNLAVSGEHAVIVTILNDSFLEDLGSTNGTMVNGQPIKKHFLQNNDMVELGKYKLKYVAEMAKSGAADLERPAPRAVQPPAVPAVGPVSGAPVAPPAGVATPTASILPVGSPAAQSAGSPASGNAGGAFSGATTEVNTAAAAPANPPKAASNDPGAGQTAIIQILNGPNAGRELTLLKALTTLGRPGVQVAVITRRPQGFFITHVEGTSFPTVNGVRLNLEAHPLKDHDVVELSGTKMEFYYK